MCSCNTTVINMHYYTPLLILLVYSILASSSVRHLDTDGRHHWAIEICEQDLERTKSVFSSKFQLLYIGKEPNLLDIHVFAWNDSKPNRNISQTVADIDEAIRNFVGLGKVADIQIAKPRKRRDASEMSFIDPMFAEAWYLSSESSRKFSMNIQEAWKLGYSGAGVVVSVLDDGLEWSHPDLLENYFPNASIDLNDRDYDPTPKYGNETSNQHGTRCAGLIAAIANNSHCSVGVAFGAKIGGIRMLDGPVTDLLEAAALALRIDQTDIFSASWGPPDDGKTFDGPGNLAKKAFAKGIMNGRNGLGSIYVWSSGNGGIFDDSCACDGYANSIYTLSISSLSENGYRPWYLEECSSTIAATYSSGEPFLERQVITTDLHGQCTNQHSGTSASAPIAAGIVALALEANPKLTWRDVQYIIVETSQKDPALEEGDFFRNGAGKLVSSRFGFGLMNAVAMVSTAKQWESVSPQHICHGPLHLNQIEIPSNGTLFLHEPNITTSCTSLKFIEHVQVNISLDYSKRGDLAIALVSPSLTRSVLLPPRKGDSTPGKIDNWVFTSVQFWGEKAAGNWTVQIVNTGDQHNNGSVYQWSVVLYGTKSLPKFLRKQRRVSHHLQCIQASNHCIKCNGRYCVRCSEGFFLSISKTQCVRKCPSCVDDTKMECKMCGLQPV